VRREVVHYEGTRAAALISQSIEIAPHL
jgi:hypothetical protein